jgi:hypothetical protein
MKPRAAGTLLAAAGQPSLHEVDMVAFSGTLSF